LKISCAAPKRKQKPKAQKERAVRRGFSFGPDELIACYRAGVFPMAEHRDAPSLFIVDPETRGYLPLDRAHIPRRLARTVRQGQFRVTADQDFLAVIDACAAPAPGRENTWISPAIRALYGELHRRGIAHSIEVWTDAGLAGGLYGVALGGAFFGESMFSRARDASKVAMAHLIGRLRMGGFTLLDAQFLTDHLAQFGVIEAPRFQFQEELAQALLEPADFHRMPADLSPAQLLQSIAQTS
jgi:leucyl/phenylalanyl-tRNA---protein transferase